MGGAGAVCVRDARPEEWPAARELTLAAYSAYAGVMEPDAWAALERAVVSGLDTRQPADRIVAERDGAVVGSVMLFPPATDAYGGAVGAVRSAGWPELRLLAVSPGARGQGVGRRLVEECIRRARAMGATDLGLHTSRSMREALRLYRSMGFVRVPEYDFQPPGAELVEAYRFPLRPGE